jgi:hypothetical protein
MSALALAGCSSTQPDRAANRSGSLSFRAQAKLGLLNCYDLWQDTSNPLDGSPDVDLQQRQCFEIPNSSISRPIPWHYSVIITLIPAGTTTEQLLTSTDGFLGTTSLANDDLDTYFSLTDYDPSEPPATVRPAFGDIVYVNGKEASWGSPIYQGAYSDSCPSCPMDLGPPNLVSGPTNFDFPLNSGDTVVVRARKQDLAHSPGFIPAEVTPLQIEIVLIATLSIGGVPVTPNGSALTSTDDASDLTFSYTVH